MLKNRKASLLAMLAALALGGSAVVSIPAVADPVAEPAPATAAQDTEYLVGTGMYDITGAAAETGSFGYASGQEMSGIHTRLFAHAYIVVDRDTGNRVAYVSTDLGAVFPSVTEGAYRELAKKFGDKYTLENTMISATHTHSGTGGLAYEHLYQIASMDGAKYGFDQRNLDTVINGIVKAIERADANLEPGTVSLAVGDLKGASRNRSLEAFKTNPEAGEFPDAVNTTVTQLNFRAADGTPLGMLNWFGMHATAFNIHNTLVTADSRGYSEWAFGMDMGADPTRDKTFVAAFPSGDAGDVVSTQGNSVSAEGFGGNEDDWINAKIDGERMYQKAIELWDSGVQLSGPIETAGHWVEFGPKYVVSGKYSRNGEDTALCKAARGWSFAPGGENGPSNIPGVYEGMTKDTLSITDKYNKVDTSVLGGLTRFAFRVVGLPFQDDCHEEKPILLPTGAWGWSPTVLPFQMAKIGNFAMFGLPFEITTMASKQIRDSVYEAFGDSVDNVMLSGYTGAYGGYLSTHAEYAVQHYEGASTEFGANQIGAAEQEGARLAKSILDGTELSRDAVPAMPSQKMTPQRPGVVYDGKPVNQEFGQVLRQPNTSYLRGQTAWAEFRGAHPKNDFHTQGTFMKVQRKVGESWVDYRWDRDFDTTYQWRRDGSARSITKVTWRIGEDTPAGVYRLAQMGDWKNGWNHQISPYEGYSNPFTVK